MKKNKIIRKLFILSLAILVHIGCVAQVGIGIGARKGKIPVEEQAQYNYTDTQITALLASGYLPVGNAEDLKCIDTNYAAGNPRTWAAGTDWEVSDTSDGLNGYYLQVADIELHNDTLEALYGSTWYDNSTGWEGIGEYDTDDFTGVYDGGNHYINNLYINAGSGDTFIGLFDAMENGSIRNVRLDSVDFTGALIGVMRGDTVENVRVTGTIDADGGVVGGVMGQSRTNQLFMDRVSFVGNVTGDQYVGGIIGYLNGNYLLIANNLYAQGTVTGDAYVGGLFGRIRYQNTSGGYDFVKNSYASMDVNGSTSVGAMGGDNTSVTWINCYYDTIVAQIGDVTGVEKPIARTTTSMKGTTSYGQVIDDTSAYMGWSGYIWNFGTANDYPIFNDLPLSVEDPLSGDFMGAWDKQNGGDPLSEELYLANEQYPAGVMLYEGAAGDSIYHIGKVANTVIAGMCSGDGINGWVKSPLPNGFFLEVAEAPPGMGTTTRFQGNTWRLIDDTYYIIYGNTLNTGSQGIAYATSDSVNENYGQHGWVINPDANDIGTDLNIADVNFIAGGPELIRIGNTYHWYGSATFGDSWGTYFIWHGTSPVTDTFNITFDQILYNGADTDWLLNNHETKLEGQVIYYPRVYYDDGYYYMTLTIGGLTELTGQRAIYVARSTTPIGFNLSNLQRTPILEGSGANTWDELRVYAHDILRENDGYWLTPHLINDSIRMYFSGHSYDDGSEYSPANTGIPGLATKLDE